MEGPAQSVRDRNGYYVMLALTAAVIAAAAVTKEFESALIAAPTLVILLIALWRRGGAYIPPMLTFIMAAMMILLQLARIGARYTNAVSVLSDVLMGMFLDLVGLIMVYSMLKATPGFDGDRPAFTAFDGFCNAMTLSLGVIVASMYLDVWLVGEDLPGAASLGPRVAAVAAGAAATSAAFYLNHRNWIFGHVVGGFVDGNADALGVSDREKAAMRRDVAAGESETVEFKSSLRTNLKTGEKDPRIEKAAMKTVVAFLNSRGGTLYIGVADDGSVPGIDVESFGSLDKLGLHMNNLLTSSIGPEFLPYISYRLVDCGDGKHVMRVACRRSEVPAFLIESGEKTFYVRSGPSSISLKGMDLLYYANHNFGKALKRPRDRARRIGLNTCTPIGGA